MAYYKGFFEVRFPLESTSVHRYSPMQYAGFKTGSPEKWLGGLTQCGERR